MEGISTTTVKNVAQVKTIPMTKCPQREGLISDVKHQSIAELMYSFIKWI